MLAVSGASLGDAVRIEVFLTNKEDDFAAMNEVYETIVSKPYPARTTVYVELPEGLKVIDAIDVVDKNSGRTRPCLSKGNLA